jgi:N-acetylmuramoyl-L-alanine amidase
MSLWTEDFVQVNKFSRPATKLVGVRGIVIHWTADPGATDEAEQNYFDGSDGGGGRYASAHIFVDRDSATLLIPLNEVAYHANEKPCKIAKLQATLGKYVGGANLTAIGVEMCVEIDGTIHPDTISRTVDVVADLCKMFKLTSNDIYRHYDITGKNCPAPFVSNPQLFVEFKNKVNAGLHPVITPTQQPVAKKKYLVLPATESSWRVYPLNKAPKKGNECGYLNPKKFGGLTYEILGNPQTDVYLIQTVNFGKVQIYAASSTGAKIVLK